MPDAINPSDLLTPQELCARLKVGKHFVANQMRPGRRSSIPHLRIGKLIRFNWPDVCAWMAANKDAGKPQPVRKVRKGVGRA